MTRGSGSGGLAVVAVVAALAGAGVALALDAPRLAASASTGSQATGSSSAPMPAARPFSGAEHAVTAAGRRLAARARALVGVRPADLGYRLVLAGPRDGVRAQADLEARTITLFLDDRDVAHRVAHDLAHELGHAYDDRHMTDARRRAWLRARGASGRPWWPEGSVSDYASGAGDFAEVFARCHAASPEFRSRVAPPPADACALLSGEASR